MSQARSPEWMAQQVKTAAGIHFQIIKDRDEAPVKPGEKEELDGSMWSPPPAFLAQMRAAEKKAGL